MLTGGKKSVWARQRVRVGGRTVAEDELILLGSLGM